ncbi:MAG: PAS domain S-box protein [Desulfobacterales bacterium]
MSSLNQVRRIFQAFFKFLDKWTRPVKNARQDGLVYWQERIVWSILLTGMVFGGLAYVPSVRLCIKEGRWLVVFFDTAIYAMVVILFFVRQIPFIVRAYAIIIASYILGMVLTLVIGPSASGPVWLFAFPIIAGIILGIRAAFVALGLNILSLFVIGAGMHLGTASWIQPAPHTMERWIVISLNFILLNAVAALSLAIVQRGLASSLSIEKTMRESIQKQMDVRMQAEKARWLSEEKLSALVENAPIGIFWTTAKGKGLDGNPEMARMLGCASPEKARQFFTDLAGQLYVDPENREYMLTQIKEKGYAENIEYEAYRIDGSTFWMLVNARINRWISEDDFEIEGFAADITQRKKAEEERQTLSSMVEQSTDAMVSTSPDFKITYVNPAAEELFGYSLAELQGQTPGVFNAETDAEAIQQAIYAALSAGKNYSAELLNKRKNGDTFICEMKASPMKNADGKIIGYMAFQRDVTQQRHTEQALKQSEAKYRHLFENAPVGIFRTTSTGNVLDVNPAMAKIVGFSTPAETVAYYHDMAAQLYVDPARRAELVRQMKQSGEVDEFEYQAWRQDGKKIWITMSARISEYLPDNEFIIEGYAVDITRRRQYEEKLLAYRMAIESSEDFIAIVDKNYVYQVVNSAYAALQGRPGHEIVGRPLAAIMGEDLFQTTIKPYLDRCLAGENQYVEARRRHPELGVIDLAISYYPLRSEEQIIGAVAILRDITEYKAAESELIESQEQLRRLSAHIEEVREKERAEIARLLHDELGQALSGLRIDTLQLGQKLRPVSPELAESTDSMVTLIDYLNNQTRQLVSDLRPGMLDDLGLIPALEWYVDHFMQRTGIHSVFSTNMPEQELADETATGIYRICQEALTNVYRHAAASLVEVELTVGDGQIALEIRDNGIGIDPQRINTQNSFGLIGMRERARALGGTLTVDRARPSGTTVRVQVLISL